jgi:hypothetical protein
MNPRNKTGEGGNVSSEIPRLRCIDGRVESAAYPRVGK